MKPALCLTAGKGPQQEESSTFTSLVPLVCAAEDIVPCAYCCLLTTSLGPGTHLFMPEGFPLLLS